MGKVKQFFLDQWDDIKGSVKYAVLYAVVASGSSAAMITGLVHHIQAMRHAAQPDYLGYIILAMLIFCAFMLVALVTIMARRSFIKAEPLRPTLSPEKTEESPANPQLELVPLPPPPPPAIDLKGEILGLYFLKSASGFGSYSVYMKLRITNHGPDEAVIVKWNLHIWIGKDDKKQASPGNISANMSLQKVDSPFMLGNPTVTYEPVLPDLMKIPATEPYRKGIPKEGWVRFDSTDYGYEPPYNAGFFIYMEDALSNSHWISRDPQSYRKDGDLVEREDLSMLGLGSGG